MLNSDTINSSPPTAANGISSPKAMYPSTQIVAGSIVTSDDCRSEGKMERERNVCLQLRLIRSRNRLRYEVKIDSATIEICEDDENISRRRRLARCKWYPSCAPCLLCVPLTSS